MQNRLLNSDVIKSFKKWSRNSLSIFLLVFLTITVFGSLAYSSEAVSFNILDADEKGTTPAGQSKGTLIPTYDPAANKDVLELDYSLGPNSSLTVWAKNFPAELTADTANTVRLGLKIGTEQLSQISVTVELKGTNGSQNIPLDLKTGWYHLEESIDWKNVGILTEAAFIITPAANTKLAEGTLSLALEFFLRAVTAPVPALSSETASAEAPELSQAAAEKTPQPEAVATQETDSEAANPAEPRSSYNLQDAQEKGVADVGLAKGSLTSTYDEAVDKDIQEIDYSLAEDSAVNFWAKGFPKEMGPETVNTVKIGLRLPETDQINQIGVKLILKGAHGSQNISLHLKSGWNSIQEFIDWDTIGNLQQITFVVSPIGDVKNPEGTLSFALEFVKRDPSKVTNTGEEGLVAYSILDAEEKGVFNIGPSKGSVTGVYDEDIAKDVWKFEYALPQGSVVGVWTKSYPSGLNADTADAARIGVKVLDPDQVNQASVKLEIKGTHNMQSIPLQLKAGWNSFKELINWNMIGDLTEVVFVVSPMANNAIGDNPLWFNPTEEGPEAGNQSTGILYFDLDFTQVTFLQKYAAFVKVDLILLLSFLLALLASFITNLSGRNRPRRQFAHVGMEEVKDNVQEVSSGTALKRDFLYGTVAVMIAAIAHFIYSLGAMNPLDGDFSLNFLVLGLMGGVVAEMLKFGITRQHLTPTEIFQNVLITGLLTVSSSRLELLAAPANWCQLLTISNLTAAIAFLIYQIFNASSLSSTGRHLKPVAAAMIVATPYIFGWLLLLENATFLQKLSNGITFGLIDAWPDFLGLMGQLLVVFGFNEAIANGIGLVTKGKTLKTAKAHLYVLLVSLGAILSPLIANLGSTEAVASFPVLVRAVIAILTTMLSFAGLWGEVYLITGILLDSGKRLAPTEESISRHVLIGTKKGLAYSGILVALIYALSILVNAPLSQKIMGAFPISVGIICGALLFPLLKTIIETFDGSLPFFERMRYSYRSATLWFRGAVCGFGFAYMVTHGLFQAEMPERVKFGLVIGLVASLGMSLLRDAVYAVKGQGRVHTWRLYFIDGLLGAFVGSAAAFYLDSLQVPVIIEKFKLYTSSGLAPVEYITYPLLNKWGRIHLGAYSGGAKLLFIESLAGVINWSIAAWLFAINKVFMQAFFDKDKTPIKFFFSKAGFAQLVEHMIYVLRWGLWMSPIIFTFLRMMPNPTWYNQDGAIRTVFAIFNSATMAPEAFQAWSLKIFIYVMAFDFFRILIWMDHMGLRVATLVNLSFIGMDKLDEKIARFIGPAAAQRYIPEGVKRFTTWAPLLIPFYLPRGQAWDFAWSTAESMQNAASRGGLLSTLNALNLFQALLLVAVGILVCTGISRVAHILHRRAQLRRIKTFDLSNREYRVVLKENGESYSEVLQKESDISRRSYDMIDPCGRVLFIVDTAEQPESAKRAWPVLGNFPREKFEPSHIKRTEDILKVQNSSNGIRSTIHISLPDKDSTTEIWNITVENLTKDTRPLKVVPYLEWVLNGGIHDRFHTQYARLYPEMEYASSANAVLSWQKSTKSMGILASDIAPEGFISSRVDFIGRARSLWSPRILESLAFMKACDTAPYPTFDPIGSLMINLVLAPGESKKIRLMIGFAKNKEYALKMIGKILKPAGVPISASDVKKSPLIGHGEIPQGTPQPYSEYADNGNKLLVHTPFTPRPFDHALSNAIHSVMVTNRGLHTSCNGNSQQNRVTPDWPDTVTKEIPSEAIYLYDPDQKEWYSPTHHPLNDFNAKNVSEFGVDGTAVFRMTRGTVATELTVFVPPQDPTGVYLLTVKNQSDRPRRMRIAPYFQMALAFMPERSGPLQTRYDKTLNALFYANERNIFRSGWAFASMSLPAECVETKRGRFFGSNRGTTHPYLVEKGKPDATQLTDEGQIAGFLGTLEIPARGESTVAIILGQADDWKQAAQLVQKYKSIDTARKSLEETRQWWLSLMKTLEVKSNNPEFDLFQNWLKYQALAERIWARRGFYQTSGAFGFRDQLQDTVNLIWVDPALARKQIILHASHQFLEGDVFHWFFTLTDGRTAFSCRSHASDNPLWLVWGVVEYIRATGDTTILDEMTSYVTSEFPFAPLPKNKQGWGHLYHRSTRADSVYRHCLRSIDLVLKKRMGKNGLPLMGTGDWNDGLDEIGSEGKGESVWLGFFLYYILKDMVGIIEKKEGLDRKEFYAEKMQALKTALERTWRGDRYLRAFHDDGTEIGLKDSGIWEIDALTAAWAVMSGINFERGLTVFNTALSVLEKEDTILLGWPALRENTKPYLGRSSKYPEGVRENGMYCHGVQWLVKAARLLAEQFDKQSNQGKAQEYRALAYRLWQKIAPLSHTTPDKIEIYGGQPNKQAADLLTTFDRGRMIWHGYTGAAGWMLRQAVEGVVGATLIKNQLVLPNDLDKPRGDLKITRIQRDPSKSPLKEGAAPRETNLKSDGAKPHSKNKVTILPPEKETVAIK